jgi:hypothetical protein
MPAHRAEPSAAVPPKVEPRAAIFDAAWLREETGQSTAPSAQSPNAKPREEELVMRLTGFAAIEYAEKKGLTVNKHPDRVDGPRVGVGIAEAEAIASEDENLIWLDVPDTESEQPPDMLEPER